MSPVENVRRSMCAARSWAVIALCCVTMPVMTASAQTPAKPQPTVNAAADLSRTLEATARQVSPAVVQIFSTSYTPGEGLVAHTADLVTTQRASGSGVIVDADGYIVTNAHVVNGAHRLRVEIPLPAGGNSILSGGSRSASAQIVGIDLETDLAVIRVDAHDLPTLTFGDSDELRAGQLVLALGSPLGLHNSVTLGVVSAIARQLEPESPMIYVQTDAAINPGSSGGALVDVRGRLMGINTLILSQAGGDDGLGFAAPGNIVRSVYEQIRKSGRVTRGDIGIRAQTITPVLASGLNLPRANGVVIADVLPGSPAARAGLRAGDLVLALDGKAMENGRQLHVGLYRHSVGDIVMLDVLREGTSLKVGVVMAQRHDSIGVLAAAIDPHENLVARLGILGVALDQQLAAMLPVLRVRSGVVVASTVAGALDSRDGGLAPGDVVHAVNRAPVAKLSDLRAALEPLKVGDPVVLQIERRGELVYLAFTID